MADARYHSQWRFTFVSLLSAAVLFSLVALLFAAAPAGQPRQAVCDNIRALARKHVEKGVSAQTDRVVEHYRNNSAGVGALEIAEIYEEEYARVSSPIPGFVPWILAVVAFVLLIFRDVLKSWITAAFNKLGKALYDRLAGTRLLRRFSLGRYERALLAKHGNVFVPFRKNLPPLKMTTVFVPLKVHAEMGRHDAEQEVGAGSKRPEEAVDVFEAIEDNRALMVLGAPGSGKTMLMRRIALAYADYSEEYLSDEPIPVLLELHRLGGEGASIEGQLVKEYERNDFPRAETFVAQALTRGTLMLLFDGLDEVDSEARRHVVQQIRDLMDTHEKCRVIITCRVAVYDDEFSDVVDKTLEIAEFNDEQVQQFLFAWKDEMPAGKSIEQLLGALRDRPRIMMLARNPLLLTIIAFLYSDPNFILPRSRAEFYKKATALLLELWHKEHNRYQEREKRSVLRHLAIQFYDLAEHEEKDRRSVDFATVLEDVKAVLPSVDLVPATDAQPLLTEIVERSGLLLSIDGGERYQFAHLTLQEFFAAEALLGDENTLFRQFRDDPDAWREVVKLWCGLASDSTQLISRVREIDVTTAFECLADAQKVEFALVDQLLEEFQGKLCESDEVIASFASVASDPRGRGAKVFEFLTDTLREGADEAARSAAGAALSQTNRSEAAEILASVCDDRPDFIIHLSNMGDLAVPVFNRRTQHADMGTTDGELLAVAAMDELEKIATPQAAASLTPLLWNSNQTIATKAAWRLARMIRDEKIEDYLRTNPRWGDPATRTTALSWLWEPFGEPPGSSLSTITGRIAELLLIDSPTSEEARQPPIDERFTVPLATGLLGEGRDSDAAVRRFDWTTVLPPDVRPTFEKGMSRLAGRSATRADWRAMYKPTSYSYRGGWHARAVAVTAVILYIMVLVACAWGMWLTGQSSGAIWFIIPALPLSCLTLLAVLAFGTGSVSDESDYVQFLAVVIPWVPSADNPAWWGAVSRLGFRSRVRRWGYVGAAAMTFTYAPLIMVAVAGVLLHHWPLYALAPYVLVLALNGWLIHTGLVRHRRSLNPFVGLFAATIRRKARRSRTRQSLGSRRKTGPTTGDMARSSDGVK